jgi:hypothetical protein
VIASNISNDSFKHIEHTPDNLIPCEAITEIFIHFGSFQTHFVSKKLVLLPSEAHLLQKKLIQGQ